MKLGIVAAVLTLAVGLAVAEDRLILKDGQVVTGKIIKLGEADVKVRVGDETVRVPRWAIEKIERESAGAQTGTVEASGKTRPARPRATRARANVPARDYPDATPELLAWLDRCAEQLASSDAGVRHSAAAALRIVGPAARPALETAAAGGDEEQVAYARKLLTHLERIEKRLGERKARGRAPAAAASPPD